MRHACLPLALKDASVFHRELTDALALSLDELALVDVPFGVSVGSLAVRHTIDKGSHVHTARSHDHLTVTLTHVSLKIALIAITVGHH